MKKYQDYQQDMQTAIQSGLMTEDGYQQALKTRIELEIDLKGYPVVQEMLKAETDYNSLVESVMNTLNITIGGSIRSGCGCGGCR